MPNPNHCRSVFNSLVCSLHKNEHISPILRSLHWLPIPERIEFKLLLLTFKSLNDVAPPYMKELLGRYRPTRTLRSADKGLLVQPNYNLKTYGYRAFSQTAPKMEFHASQFMHML